MITLESTIRPKSIAPRLIRLAVTPVASMTLAAKSIDSGIASATIRPPRMLPSSTSRIDDDQHAALDQVVQHRVEGLVDQVGAVVERLDRHARRAGSSGARRSRALTSSTTRRPFSPMSIITSPVTISPWPSRVTSPARIIGAGWTLRHVADRHRDAVALVDDDRRDVLDVVRLALAPDVPRLALVDEVAAADVRVVATAAR